MHLHFQSAFIIFSAVHLKTASLGDGETGDSGQ